LTNAAHQLIVGASGALFDERQGRARLGILWQSPPAVDIREKKQ
jgi:hypothetical protein